MKPHRAILLWGVGMLLLAAVSPSAEAAGGILTTINNQYQAASAGWMTASLAMALHLFYLLLAIELPLSAIGYLFYKEGLADFFAAFLLKLLALLFFYVLIVQAPLWIPAIIHSFIQAGSTIGGTTTLDPSGVFDQGITVANTALQGINKASIFDSLLIIIIAGLAALTIVIAYAVIAAQLLVTLIESYIVIGGGALMLGFAGLRWSLVFTERYLGYVMSVGIKLFVLYLIIGLGQSLAPQFMTVLADAARQGLPQPSVYFDLMGGALVFMVIGWQVPLLASSLMTGSPSLTFGGAASTGAMLTTALANAVAKSLQATVNTTQQTADAAAGVAKLAQAAKMGLGEERRAGASLPTALGKTAGDISRAASQQFRDNVLRGTGRESAAAAARAAGSQAVQGWGSRHTPG